MRRSSTAREAPAVGDPPSPRPTRDPLSALLADALGRASDPATQAWLRRLLDGDEADAARGPRPGEG